MAPARDPGLGGGGAAAPALRRAARRGWALPSARLRRCRRGQGRGRVGATALMRGRNCVNAVSTTVHCVSNNENKQQLQDYKPPVPVTPAAIQLFSDIITSCELKADAIITMSMTTQPVQMNTTTGPIVGIKIFKTLLEYEIFVRVGKEKSQVSPCVDQSQLKPM